MARPFSLDPLFRALTTLPGVGPRNAKLFEKLTGGQKVLDLIFHLPIDVIDRRFSPKIKEIPDGRVVTLALTVDGHQPNEQRGKPYRIRCRDETGFIMLVYFNASRDWLKKQYPDGAEIVVSGRAEYFREQPQIVHPDAVGKPEERASIETLEPVYPLTAGLTNKVVRKAAHAALDFASPLPEWIDAAHKAREGWSDWDTALRAAHMAFPSPDPRSSLGSPSPRGEGRDAKGVEGEGSMQNARSRLAYDELLANQLAISLVRAKQKKLPGRSLAPQNDLREKILAALPFALTGAQERSLREIDADMAAPSRMFRLLQGDVGSGKTVVAALAMMNAVENGLQGAIMAPTEILARQHAESLKPWLDAAGVRFVVLTGRNKGKERDVLLQQVANGAAQIVIGTHALFQDDVAFQDLGLAVIDEQHRFGVHQRLKLSSKSKGMDVLVMTATPIPRTLTLTAYGDMDVSRLDEKPPGRKPVDTRLIPKEKIESMIDGLRRQLETGARAYWVCPLVEESEFSDMAAAEERYDVLKSFFGERVGLVHGRMKPDEKDAVMAAFASGALSILVATTVIEVGVNVPEATIMVIEHAERFGLAQLHQLRGRVGRGGDKSYCFLLYATPVNDTAKERLATMRDTEDGFIIAEKDLQLRGGGDVLGVRQSGLPVFRLADLEEHAGLLRTAYDDARLIVSKDPELNGERGQALRTLLYLFERDRAIKLLRGG